MRTSAPILVLLLLGSTSGCIGLGQSNEGPDVYWIDVTASYTATHNNSTQFDLFSDYIMPFTSYCSTAYRDGGTGVFHQDEVPNDSKIVIHTEFADADGSHWTDSTKRFKNESIEWKGLNISFANGSMLIGNETIEAGESVTVNNTITTDGEYDSDGDGWVESFENVVTVNETLVINFYGKIPTKATGGFACD